jgi:branched-chain amino acid aminotransferase
MLANTKHIRASPGGMGEYKVGGNYGPTVQSLKEIYAQGFSQSLWMLPDGQI